jgi:hypothetical protein
VQLGNHAVVTAEGLRQLAAMNPSPYIVFREEQQDLVWDGPAAAYEAMFTSPSAQMEAESTIKRAMRKF